MSKIHKEIIAWRKHLKNERKMRCKACDGTGYCIDMPCDKCKGIGEIECPESP